MGERDYSLGFHKRLWAGEIHPQRYGYVTANKATVRVYRVRLRTGSYLNSLLSSERGK